ncbi:endoribonuclease L-PSP [Chlorella sorokiniana]|uniref:Endoribonuclease L-PSP n=1 Tax=Chlorella sorokiniana TaxID=3076 RepID=A0A2P6TX80_CHLSO|nr:endoribonuclease L-PSP [Chlorella sorokiniana]|eukprot:PRW58661.1 endoribonuclease L-PSP [Chlorella sorokiniana]
MEYMGRTVAKSFPGYGRKKFKGTVTSVVEPEPGVHFFNIEYEDGDEEEVELYELERILLPDAEGDSKAAGGKSSSAAAQGGSSRRNDTAAKGGGKAQRGGKAAGKGEGRKRKKSPGSPEPARGAEQPAAEAAADADEEEEEAAAAVQEAMQQDGEEQQATEPLLREEEEGEAEHHAWPGSAATPPAGGGPLASPSSERGLTAQLRGIADEVATRSKELELNIARYPAAQQAEDPALRSRVVTCGSVCYTSALRPAGGRLVPDDAPEEEQFDEYKAQATDVLTQLEAALREAGSSKDCLLAVTVLLKDLPVGRKPFAAAFNQWVDAKALPAMTLLESYLGRDEILVSVAATAAVPSTNFA